MNPLYAVIFLLCAVIVAMLPVYLRMIRPKRTVRTVMMKTAMSLCFTGIGVLAARINPDGWGTFATLMVAGFLFSVLGDLLLGLPQDKEMVFVLGALGFLVAHVFYISAYIQAGRALGLPVFTWAELAAISALLLAAVLVRRRVKLKLEKLAVPVLIYAAAILTMAVKAVSLGIGFVTSGAENGGLILAVLSTGALLFAFSDALLGFMMFGDKRTPGTSAMNMWSYYAGQILLALSLLLIA
ncbi:MAG: lysoplasmalogenase [Clostridiales bacterium]|nr:lysoplasmalogenase [Clostridiales bacterium]